MGNVRQNSLYIDDMENLPELKQAELMQTRICSRHDEFEIMNKTKQK